jgi:hypothetical protein
LIYIGLQLFVTINELLMLLPNSSSVSVVALSRLHVLPKLALSKCDAQPRPNNHIRLHQSSTKFIAVTTAMPPTEDKRRAARETIDVLYEISSLLVRVHLIHH